VTGRSARPSRCPRPPTPIQKPSAPCTLHPALDATAQLGQYPPRTPRPAAPVTEAIALVK
jgi:hypothetical protein